MRPPRRPRRLRLAAAVVLAPVLSGLLAPAAATAAPVPVPLRAQLTPLNTEEAWQHSTGAGVTVAVLDSGVDADHPALAGRVLPGADFVDGSTDGHFDPVGHGTAVASLIAGAGDAAITGLAPDATILPVRVLDEENRYRTASTVADGVIWAVDEGADVINLSLGGQRASTALAGAIAYAMERDVVVVACTGNARDDTPDRIWYPAREPGVLAVAGLEWGSDSPGHWPRSLAGRETVLAAPATMTAAAPGGSTRQVRGTSFSAAVVSAAAALVRARWSQARAGEVVHRLVATAKDIGAPGRDPQFGFGLVNPVGALTAQLPAVRNNPLDTKARHGQAGLGTAPSQGELRGTGEPELAVTQHGDPPGGGAEPPGGAVTQPAGVPSLGLAGVGALAATAGTVMLAAAAVLRRRMR